MISLQDAKGILTFSIMILCVLATLYTMLFKGTIIPEPNDDFKTGHYYYEAKKYIDYVESETRNKMGSDYYKLQELRGEYKATGGKEALEKSYFEGIMAAQDETGYLSPEYKSAVEKFNNSPNLEGALDLESIKNQGGRLPKSDNISAPDDVSSKTNVNSKLNSSNKLAQGFKLPGEQYLKSTEGNKRKADEITNEFFGDFDQRSDDYMEQFSKPDNNYNPTDDLENELDRVFGNQNIDPNNPGANPPSGAGSYQHLIDKFAPKPQKDSPSLKDIYGNPDSR